ncbi:GDSL esterase/lipase At5g03610-like [Nymphaea colorata]|uniref:GDSL esterase/lipase At5g03610-like n=1 Tax=Nymphaea colorata TaxID=210225 RepID=UPI00129EF04A|nr:GDSL esterase/lipase At5g03610-like [Nymphaea colorata]
MEARFFLCFLLALLLGSGTEGHGHRHHHRRHHLVKRLFVFGDSYADTGNIWRGLANCWKSPYGSTFPGKPAGRFSDGRVITDFVATYLGVPSPVPYRLESVAGHRSRYGINFAYGGTGVFDTAIPLPNMTTQIDFLEQLIKDGTYGPRQLRSSMAFVSIGGNDYLSYLYFGNGTIARLKSFIRSVVNRAEADLERLVRLGVGRIGVLGLGPVGCVPFNTQNISYSSCVDLFNQNAVYHNALLQKAVDAINAHPSHRSRVEMLSVFDAWQSLIHGPQKLGQESENPLRPCCMGITPLNGCGDTDQNGKPLYKVCEDPEKAVFWDSVHPTQATWSRVFRSFRPTLQQLVSYRTT